LVQTENIRMQRSLITASAGPANYKEPVYHAQTRQDLSGPKPR
jgi:hypothetical protein